MTGKLWGKPSELGHNSRVPHMRGEKLEWLQSLFLPHQHPETENPLLIRDLMRKKNLETKETREAKGEKILCKG